MEILFAPLKMLEQSRFFVSLYFVIYNSDLAVIFKNNPPYFFNQPNQTSINKNWLIKIFNKLYLSNRYSFILKYITIRNMYLNDKYREISDNIDYPHFACMRYTAPLNKHYLVFKKYYLVFKKYYFIEN